MAPVSLMFNWTHLSSRLRVDRTAARFSLAPKLSTTAGRPAGRCRRNEVLVHKSSGTRSSTGRGGEGLRSFLSNNSLPGRRSWR